MQWYGSKHNVNKIKLLKHIFLIEIEIFSETVFIDLHTVSNRSVIKTVEDGNDYTWEHFCTNQENVKCFICNEYNIWNL